MGPTDLNRHRPLTRRQQRFAHEYCVDGCAAAAARRAGYASRQPECASTTGIRLLKHPAVQAIIENSEKARIKAIAHKSTPETVRLTTDVANSVNSLLAFLTMDETGQFRWKKLTELTASQVEQLVTVNVADDGSTIGVTLKNPTDALNKLLLLLDR